MSGLPQISNLGHDVEVTGERYSDFYTDNLNKLCSVQEALGLYHDRIAAGEIDALVHFTGSYGVSGIWKERVLNKILNTAVRVNGWQGIEEESDVIDMVVETGFVFKGESQGKTYAIPNLRFVAYCNDRKFDD